MKPVRDSVSTTAIPTIIYIIQGGVKLVRDSVSTTAIPILIYIIQGGVKLVRDSVSTTAISTSTASTVTGIARSGGRSSFCIIFVKRMKKKVCKKGAIYQFYLELCLRSLF